MPAVKELIISEVESPTFEGMAFGDVGPYESIVGRALCEIDPAAPQNRGIVNLDKAPRNAAGLVEYDVDVYMLRPVDPGRGNGWLFYEVLNRGGKRSINRINNGSPSNTPRLKSDVGTGFLMNEGYTLVWTGWQGELAPAPGLMTARLPIAAHEDRPITGRTLEEFIDESDGPTFVGRLTYPAASLDRAEATLTIRERERDARATPPGLSWRYLDERRIEITRPPGRDYDKGAIYEFVYTARDPIVSGLAFASVRDIVSWLRSGEADGAGNPNPMVRNGHNEVRRAMLLGISQSGRFVRDFLYQGFNQDLDGRQVFEAAVPIIAGSRKTFINYPFAQPGRYSRQHEDHCYPGDQFPFTYTSLTDPISGRTDDILAQCRETGTDPKIMHIDTDSEIWSARASLVVTDCEGRDIDLPANVRAYLAAGLQHGTPPRETFDKIGQPPNPVGYGALTRPLLVALKRWVEDGVEPPPSRFPRIADGTLVTLDEGRKRFPSIPGAPYPSVYNELRLMDHRFAPAEEGPAYPVFVSTTDADGNGDAGIRHPLLDAPTATHVGWNLRAPGHAAGELAGVIGSLIPFTRTGAEREASGDPRPSFEERYGDKAGFVKALREACDRLVGQGYFLREDADRLMAAAENGDDLYTAV